MTTNSINLQFRYSKEEYVAAVRQYYQSFHVKVSTLFSLMMLLLGVFLAVVSADSFVSSFMVAIGVFGLLVFLLNYFVWPPKLYERNPQLRREYNLQFSDEGILFRSQDIESALQWSLYRRVRETEKFYFLVYGRDSFTLIPKRIFTSREQEYEFRLLLRNHVDRTLDPEELTAAASPQAYSPKSLEPPDWRS